MARVRDDEDDFDDRPSRSGEMGPLDKTFRDTNIVVLVLFSVCCGVIALILSLIGYLTAKDPKAKSNALLVLIISGALSAIGIVLNVVMGVGGAMMGGGGGGR